MVADDQGGKCEGGLIRHSGFAPGIATRKGAENSFRINRPRQFS
jgi:hypothetical protein